MSDRRWASARGLLSVLAAIALFGAVLALPRTVAGFTATTDNTATTVVADTVDAPTTVVATDGVSISVDWTATVDSYATGYRVLRSTTSGGPFSQIAEIADTNIVTYIDSPPEGTYFYTLRTFHLSWEGNNSSETSGKAWRPFDCPNDLDLRACIRFDEDLGASFADESAYGNMVAHLGASQVPGISSAAAYGAPGSRYEIADSASLDMTDALTMEAWLRFRLTADLRASGNHRQRRPVQHHLFRGRGTAMWHARRSHHYSVSGWRLVSRRLFMGRRHAHDVYRWCPCRVGRVQRRDRRFEHQSDQLAQHQPGLRRTYGRRHGQPTYLELWPDPSADMCRRRNRHLLSPFSGVSRRRWLPAQ